MNSIQGIKVKGSNSFREDLQEALDFISKYPEYLNYIQENISEIKEVKFNGGASSFYKKVYLTPRHLDSTMEYNASGIIHEAAHIEDFSKKNLIAKIFSKGRKPELFALKKQKKFLDKTNCYSEIEFIDSIINKLELKDYRFGDSFWRWTNLGFAYSG